MELVKAKEIVKGLEMKKGGVPYDGVYCNNDYSFQWFKVNNENELDALLKYCDRSGEYSKDMVSVYPEWICVSTQGDIDSYNDRDFEDGYVEISTLSACRAAFAGLFVMFDESEWLPLDTAPSYEDILLKCEYMDTEYFCIGQVDAVAKRRVDCKCDKDIFFRSALLGWKPIAEKQREDYRRRHDVEQLWRERAGELMMTMDYSDWVYPWMAKVTELVLEYLTLEGLQDAMRAGEIPDEIMDIVEKELKG